jgi:hypothetical protein
MFTPTTKNNPCQSCGDIKGNCRSTDDVDFILCMAATDSHSTPSGWIFKGLDKSQGLWGQLSKDNDNSNPEYLENKREADRLRKIKAERDESARLAKLPPVEQRHKHYRQRISSQSLDRSLQSHERFFDDISRRGITMSEIRSIGIFATNRGYAVPIYNLDGFIVGAQIKCHDGHYEWIEKGLNQVSGTGQLPLAIWGNRLNPARIVLVEGTGLKPYLASKRLAECLVIGASGGRHTTSYLELGQILGSYPDAKIVLMPDGGAINNLGVMNGYGATQKFVKETGRELLVGWWGQTTKDGLDIDEIGQNTQIEVIHWDRFEEYHRKSKQVEASIYRVKKASVKASKYGAISLGNCNRDVDIEYNCVADLDSIYSGAVASPNIRAVLDASITGSGKSTLSGQVRNVVGIKTHMYVHTQHRNPTTPEVEIGYSDVPSRHDGLYINPLKVTPMGKPWLQTSQADGQEWERTDSNCHLAAEQQAWRETGHNDGGDKNPICNLCPHNSICHIKSGEGYGYKHERNSALMQSRVRISPMSLPDPSRHDYSATMTIWDDQELTHIRQITAKESDVDKVIAQLMVDIPLILDLEPILTSIKVKLSQASYYGHDWNAIVGNIKIDDLEAKMHRAAEILSPDLSSLRLSEDFSPSPLEKLGFKVEQKPETLLSDIAVNWFISLLEIMTGKVIGTMRIMGDKLIIKQKDSYHTTIASKVALTVVLNATKTRSDLAIELGIKPEQILVISQPVPSFSNLTIKMIDGVGNPTKNRAKSMDDRITAATAAIERKHGSCAVIDKIKDFQGRGLWFRDSVGTNIFKEHKALLMIGAPTPNLGHLADLYTCLTGEVTESSSKKPDFLTYVKRQVAGHVIQGIGRLRAQHRPEADLHCYIACDREDFPISEMMNAYPGAKFQAVAIEDICVTAASSRTQLRIKLAQLILDNPNITRVEAATRLCISKATLTDMFKEFGRGFREGSTLLYKALYSKVDLANSSFGNWAKHLDEAVVEYLTALVDDITVDLEYKRGEVADAIRCLNSFQITALFEAIGWERTEFIIELLQYELFQQIPMPHLTLELVGN